MSKPTFPDVVLRMIRAQVDQVHTTLPAAVVDYDPVTQTCTAQPLVLRGYIDGDSGDRVTETLPAVAGVPVVFLSGGAFRLTFPVGSNDTGLLLVSSQRIDLWRATATGSQTVDPKDDRHHNLSDAIFLPGLRTGAGALQSPPTDGISLGSDNGPVLEITAAAAYLGGRAGAQPTLKATTFLADLGTLVGAIATAVGTIPGGAGALTDIGTALTTFQNAAAAYTSTIANVK